MSAARKLPPDPSPSDIEIAEALVDLFIAHIIAHPALYGVNLADFGLRPAPVVAASPTRKPAS